MTLSRPDKLLIGLGIAALILLGKLFYIQILNGRFKRDASNNSMVYSTVYAPRGVIYDRNGKELVTNKVGYDIMVTPRDVKEFDTLALSVVLDTTVDYIRERMAYYRKYRTRIGYQTLTFLKRVPVESYLRFSEFEYRFPGFSSQVRSERDYPYDAGGNLLGYVSEVDQKFLDMNPGVYKSGDYAGKTGIEAMMEEQLRGEKGYRIFLRDARNKIQSSYQNGAYDVPAVPGKDVVTTIDAELQSYGQLLMNGKTGSVVALEPSTGEILAMVSSPGISVNQLTEIGKYYNELLNDKNKPMFNRTVMASYPPGSVFKLVNGLIGLQEGVLKPEYEYPCNMGYAYTPTRKLGCHFHNSPLNFLDAIATSCNGYFCFVLRNILQNPKYGSIQEAFDVWRDYVLSFGFGRKLGSDFPSELGGNIPSSEYYDNLYGEKGWKFPTIVSLSIGQGEIGATPLQIANLAATVANRGYYYIPHLIKDSKDIKIDTAYLTKQYTKVDSSYFEVAVQGMYMAVNGGGKAGGTALSGRVRGLDICGKTGTAQNPHGKDNAVFICFAPKDDPKIAVAVYVENAGFGATYACPVASLMVEKYLTGEITRPNMQEWVINTVTTNQ